MPLSAGTSLGPYQVTAKIGEGGMGEVWQARDTKLDRDVALKVLPEAFTADPDRLARFEREAKVLASLNHPNIGSIYGLEEAEGVKALVLELVEGPTLADRIAKGPIPLDEALPIAKQIAEALEAAHEAGVIHRDLKPANIKVREDGTVKVLDFGLAKAFQPDASDRSLSASPTISLTAAATQMGMVIGTAAYMAPEQAKGRPVDKRADVWAFGAVLFEMLTGARVFAAGDVSDTLAYVLTKEIDWTTLPADTPPALGRLLRRCLVRDPKRRLRDIGDALLDLDDPGPPSASETPADVASPTGPAVWQRPLPVGIALLAALAVGALGTWSLSRRPDAGELIRLTLIPSDTAPFTPSTFWPDLALSADGTFLVHQSTGENGRPRLAVRPLGQWHGVPLEGTEGSSFPFLSPDGQWVGFHDIASHTRLQKVPISGGPAVTVTTSELSIAGASWGDDDQIVFGTLDGGLFRVSSGGGAPEVLTSVDPDRGNSHAFPFIIPGRQAVIFDLLALGGFQSSTDSHLAVLDLGTNTVTELGLAGSRGHYVETGHLVYQAGDDALHAVPFDTRTLEVTGSPVALLADVALKASLFPNFSVSDNGRLVYTERTGATRPQASLVWVDPEGRETLTAAPPRDYDRPRISPDGTSVALDIRNDDNPGVWVFDLARETLSKLTTSRVRSELAPVWAPTGERIAYRGDLGVIQPRGADGTGPVGHLFRALRLVTRRRLPAVYGSSGRQRRHRHGGDGRVRRDDLAAGHPVQRGRARGVSGRAVAGLPLGHLGTAGGLRRAFPRARRPPPDLDGGRPGAGLVPRRHRALLQERRPDVRCADRRRRRSRAGRARAAVRGPRTRPAILMDSASATTWLKTDGS